MIMIVLFVGFSICLYLYMQHKFFDKDYMPCLFVAFLVYTFIVVGVYAGTATEEEYRTFTSNYGYHEAKFEKMVLSSGTYYLIKGEDPTTVFLVPESRVALTKVDSKSDAVITVAGKTIIRTPKYQILYILTKLDNPGIEIIHEAEHVDIHEYK